jgi:hypothetical protein
LKIRYFLISFLKPFPNSQMTVVSAFSLEKLFSEAEHFSPEGFSVFASLL